MTIRVLNWNRRLGLLLLRKLVQKFPLLIGFSVERFEATRCDIFFILVVVECSVVDRQASERPAGTEEEEERRFRLVCGEGVSLSVS